MPFTAPTAEEYGAHLPAVLQVHGDRLAILKLMSKLPSSERNLLPDVQQTADGLYARATDVARTLNAMDAIWTRKAWRRSTTASRDSRGSRTIRSGPVA